MKKSRSHKRVYELFCKAAAGASAPLVKKAHQLQFSFFRSPVALLPSHNGDRLAGVRLEKTFLQGLLTPILSILFLLLRMNPNSSNFPIVDRHVQM